LKFHYNKESLYQVVIELHSFHGMTNMVLYVISEQDTLDNDLSVFPVDTLDSPDFPDFPDIVGNMPHYQRFSNFSESGYSTPE